MRHAQLRNEIERLFGVIKRRFRILLIAPEYDLDLQARIPVGATAIHNFILFHEPLDFPEGDPIVSERHGDSLDPDHRASSEVAEESEHELPDAIGDARREEIATEMWNDYVELRRQRGIPVGVDVDLEPVVEG